ncbi:kinase-like domain-containing protein [Lipomyces tetrasporus]|uniref:mitogen-activated protein kinase kinase n=1 Tax=Lipomyces tetrasporus TaxID=54092 RepID=A0AAD7QMY8_9ASCO|nr:kinase-like domain-containing protein [Lipomyces tetrasporus]KAJ8097965.1 kinase-like domain-containing protein [Lipomyces tetrasporus]
MQSQTQAQSRPSPFARPRRVSSIVQTPVSALASTQLTTAPRVGLASRADRYDPPNAPLPVSTFGQPLASSENLSTNVPESVAQTTSSVLGAKSLKRRNFKQLSLPSAATAPRPHTPTSLDGLIPSRSQSSTSLSVSNLNTDISNRGGSRYQQDLPLASLEDAQVPGGPAELYYHNNLVQQLATLEVGVEFRLDLRMEDFKTLVELGAGNGGTVSKVVHLPTKTLMAKKMIHIEAKPAVRKQIVRELHIMHECHSRYIVSFYGAFVNEGDVVMCMEYMDCGSLDRILKKKGPLKEDILGKIAEAVVEGLTYLYNLNRIIHRDVKPSNVLVNSHGQIKLCDFGVSGELINSIADTFVGTSTYMSPERIQGAAYSVKSDVWSLGLMLLELAIGHFPFEKTESSPLSILDLLQQIVNEPAPSLPADGGFSADLRACIDRCLIKDVDARPTPQDLLADPFVLKAKKMDVDTQRWAQSTLD